ncbi:MAG: ATP-dependent 6-phosphofructokinase [Victivallales bacterium]|nr:ATP-dependent 6-phosphofructokinase [Victivallales bacterium]
MNDFNVKKLGEPTIGNPLVTRCEIAGWERSCFMHENERVLRRVTFNDDQEVNLESFEKAGSHGKIYFQPSKVKAAIATCGGICPGLNDVIRALVMDLRYLYGVDDIFGVRYGYSGLALNPPAPIKRLTPELVSSIHDLGGTKLGSSRGCPTVEEMVDTLERERINIFFTIGGDGTLRGAHDISLEIQKRDLDIAVVGIPKTIDNDVVYVFRSFGFQTAVEKAKEVLGCAHVEAKSALDGIGLVKLMGRDAGFIAAEATKASGDVNFCLVPEVKFPLDGENGLIAALEWRLKERGHSLIAVAEGAGAHLIGESGEKDASGNPLHKDIGIFLKSEIKKRLNERGIKPSVKYIDPSYIIRSVPANGYDSIFCADLARAAVHAAMSGRTDMLVGYWHGEFTNVPLTAVHGKKKRINVNGAMWRKVLATTGQPLEWQ